jgi:hypothetical protein
MPLKEQLEEVLVTHFLRSWGCEKHYKKIRMVNISVDDPSHPIQSNPIQTTTRGWRGRGPSATTFSK